MNREPVRDKGKFNMMMGIVLFSILVFVLVIVIVLAIKKNTGAVNAGNDSETETEWTGLQDEDMPEKWQEGVVSYNGERYLYNTNIDTYLYMGIDHEGPVVKTENLYEGGQSDAMFLLVVDKKAEKISVIAIHRNTMTEIDRYDAAGNYFDTKEMQICLQHGYGDGERLSCTRSVKAVERLFYNIPISGYLSLNMGALPIINDSVGGVTVEVLEDLNSSAKNVSLKKGETVTLTGDEAYIYIRSRDTNEFDSATNRLNRQMQYLNALLPQAKKAVGGSVSKVMDIYEKVEKYMVTNIDFANLAEEVMDYGFDSSNMYQVPGETVMGEIYEEYYPDDKALYELVLEVFYNKVEE